MPRNREEVRRRLQIAALELYQERGYESTTASEIATRAGVTERTFFRHFPDKREVLFNGEAVLGDELTRAVLGASPEFGPWDTLLLAFRSAEHLFIENRSFAEPRRRLIAGSPALQEREVAKLRTLVATLAAALRERGVQENLANLAAAVGMAALGHAVTAWFEDAASNLDDHILYAFQAVRDLASSSSRIERSAQPVGKSATLAS